jgi:hypothetical protein
MYIIVKYAELNFPDGKAPLSWSETRSYTARQCGIQRDSFPTKKEAEAALALMREFNPSVGYGICEAIL